MNNDLVIRGLPHRLAQDGWWLEDAGAGAKPPPAAGGATTGGRGAGPGIGAALCALVLVGDLLFYRQPVGLSLALFAAGIFASVAIGQPWRRVPLPLALLLAGALPVVVFLQPLSVAFLCLALAAAVVLIHHPSLTAVDLLLAAQSLLRRVPFGGIAALLTGSTRALRQQGAAQGLRDWGLPLGGALVFGALLVDANPVLAKLLEIERAEMLRRGLFWLGLGHATWPLLAGIPALPAPTAPRAPRRVWGVNAVSTLRALWLFNAVIGLQTVLDLSLLTGGATLPEGMTHAEYAHRGAYPLLATACLAGGFALLARPFLDEDRSFRPLMLLWLAQNVALCVSALLRLDLYVSVYGLTYLRVHSAVWIALVAAGLALIAWQTLRRRSSAWLFGRALALGFGTLYLSCFVNFAEVVARHNLALPRPDLSYLCSLGPTAAGAFADAVLEQLPGAVGLATCRVAPPQIEGWRDYGFRNWRVARYVAVRTGTEPAR